MKAIILNKLSGAIISDSSTGASITKEIQDALIKDQTVEVDFEGIKAMATFCAKQIFGALYLSLGASAFFDKVYLKNANDNIKKIIKLGIQDALDDKNNFASA